MSLHSRSGFFPACLGVRALPGSKEMAVQHLLVTPGGSFGKGAGAYTLIWGFFLPHVLCVEPELRSDPHFY